MRSVLEVDAWAHLAETEAIHSQCVAERPTRMVVFLPPVVAAVQRRQRGLRKMLSAQQRSASELVASHRAAERAVVVVTHTDLRLLASRLQKMMRMASSCETEP